MSDKTDNSSAERIGEAIKSASGAGEAISKFVQDLLPKVEIPNSSQNSSSDSTTRSGTDGLDNRLSNKSDASRAQQEQRSNEDAIKQGQGTVKEGIGELLKEHEIKNGFEKYDQKIQLVMPGEKGVIKLKTGDTLVRAGDVEVLVMPNGGALMVKPDGSYELSTKDPVQVTHNSKTGATTLRFGKDESVTISGGRITDVTRGGASATMMEAIQPRWKPEFDWEQFKDRPAPNKPRYPEVDRLPKPLPRQGENVPYSEQTEQELRKYLDRNKNVAPESRKNQK